MATPSSATATIKRIRPDIDQPNILFGKGKRYRALCEDNIGICLKDDASSEQVLKPCEGKKAGDKVVITDRRGGEHEAICTLTAVPLPE